MRSKNRGYSYFPISFMLLLILTPVFSDTDAVAKKVIVIFPYAETNEWDLEFDSGLFSRLKKYRDIEINSSVNYLGLELIPKKITNEEILRQLEQIRIKYDPDLIVAVFPAIHKLMIEYGETYFPGIPKIFVPILPQEYEEISQLPDSYIIKSSSEYTIRKNLDTIKRLMPDLQQLVVTVGSEEDNLLYLKLFIRIADEMNLDTQVKITYYTGTPLEEIYKKIANLPKNTAIFMLPFNNDINGVSTQILNYFPEYSDHASAPIFTFIEEPFSVGIVGGALTSPTLYGEATAEMAIKILSGRQDEIIPGKETFVERYDWRELKKWNLDEKRLPPDSEVLFRMENFFQHYKTRIVIIVALILLETALTFGLLVNLFKRKRTETELKRNEEVLDRSQKIAGLGGWELDPEHGNMFFTKELYNILEMPHEETPSIEYLLNQVVEENKPAVENAIMQLQTAGTPFDLEFRYKSPEGKIIWLRCVGAAKRVQNKLILLSGIIQNITKHKSDELKIQESLHEKEVLLKEVHHRVKNNLAIISSMLSLQADSIQDASIKEIILTSQNRVRSMAMIHEQMYINENLTSISFREYSEQLVGSLIQDYQNPEHPIETNIDISEIQMGMDLLVPVGIIINEIVSNSLNHAFTGISRPHISVSAEIKDDNLLILEVKDNGTGLPEESDPENTGSIGLLLINSLIKQIRGKLFVTRKNGTSYRIMFPINM